MAVSDATRTAVAIVGGGITGLAAALRLTDAAAPFLLVEAERRLGGKIATENVDGFIVEGGPDCFLASKPGGIGLVKRLGLEARLTTTNPEHRRTYVRRGERLHQLPEGITGLVPTRIGPLLTTGTLSPLGRVRAGCEVLLPARMEGGDESIARFARRRFGKEAYDWLIEPLLSGIYAGDGDQLSLAATFPQLVELERTQGSVLRAMARRAAESPRAGTVTGFVTLAGGLSELVDALVRCLPRERLRLGCAVTSIERRGPGYGVLLEDGSSITADRVILALPAPAAARVLERLDPALGRELRGIPVVSTATVSLGFPAGSVTQRLDGYGFVSPRAAGGPIVAGTWTSNKFPGRGPQGATLVRFFIGRLGLEQVVDQPDDTLVDLARFELRRLTGVTETPSVARVFRWPQSMPQYVVGHADRLERIARLLEGVPGLMVAGASYRGVGIPDCITSGWSAAEGALGLLGAAA
jgi:oxygen-dependent protoporphyrinogen oxidase